LDALSPSELQKRIRSAITRHMDVRKWKATQKVEAAERESFSIAKQAVLDAARGAA
jgi:hypothetical protein